MKKAARMLSRCFCIGNHPSHLGTDAQFNAAYSTIVYNPATFSNCAAQIDVIQFSLPDAGVSEVID